MFYPALPLPSLPPRAAPRQVSRAGSTASYRISVFTGPDKNGGTRGRVFIRLQGRRGEGADAAAVKSNLVCINPDGTPLKEWVAARGVGGVG